VVADIDLTIKHLVALAIDPEPAEVNTVLGRQPEIAVKSWHDHRCVTAQITLPRHGGANIQQPGSAAARPMRTVASVR